MVSENLDIGLFLFRRKYQLDASKEPRGVEQRERASFSIFCPQPEMSSSDFVRLGQRESILKLKRTNAKIAWQSSYSSVLAFPPLLNEKIVRENQWVHREMIKVTLASPSVITWATNTSHWTWPSLNEMTYRIEQWISSGSSRWLILLIGHWRDKTGEPYLLVCCRSLLQQLRLMIFVFFFGSSSSLLFSWRLFSSTDTQKIEITIT